MSSPTDPTSEAAESVPDVLAFRDFFPAFVDGNRVSLRVQDEHLEACDLYEAAILGLMPGYDYFNINMPTRVGKTKLLEALACWMFGEFDDPQILSGCYSEKLVERSVAYVAKTLVAPWFIDLYGDILHSRRADTITTTAGGMLYGAGTGATITGFGAGLKELAGGYIALDDAAKPDAALSKVESANTIQNFETTWKSRRNSDKYTPIFNNMQRLGPDDLSGYLEKTYRNKTFTLKFPCMVGTGPGARSRFDDTWSIETLRDLEKTRIGRFVLASQFQQQPIALGGNLIQTDSFRYYDPKDVASMQFDTIVITVDTALKAKELNDYSCFQAWGRSHGRAYLLDQAWGKWESPELLTTAIAFWRKTQTDFPTCGLRMVIEEKAAGTGLVQQLHAAGVPAEGIERDIDKVRRVQAILPYQEAGLVYIPQPTKCEENHWVHGFLAECAEFKPDMTHAHDDRVDTFADGVAQLLGTPMSILELMGARPRG